MLIIILNRNNVKEFSGKNKKKIEKRFIILEKIKGKHLSKKNFKKQNTNQKI